MMKKILMIAATFAALTACNKSVLDTANTEAGFGHISLGVEANDEMVVTKALTQNDSLKNYHIGLFDNNANNAPVWKTNNPNLTVDSEGYITYEDAIKAANSDIWKVKAGTYTVKVYNKKATEAYNGNGEVRVEGANNNIIVKAGHTTSAQVDCNPVNSKISFATTESFDNVFKTPSVNVKEGSRDIKVTTLGTKGNFAGATEVYFEPVQVTWTLTATANLDNQAKTYTGTVTLEKAKWSQVKFSTSTTDGVLNLTITVNDKITDVIAVEEVVDPFNPAQPAV